MMLRNKTLGIFLFVWYMSYAYATDLYCSYSDIHFLWTELDISWSVCLLIIRWRIHPILHFLYLTAWWIQPLDLKEHQIHKWYSDSFSWSEHHANPRVNEARYALIASEWRGRDQWPGKNKSFYALLVLWRRPTATARRKIETFGQGNSSLSSPVSRLFVGIRCKCPKTCNPVFLIVGNKGIRMTNMARPR